MVLYKITIPESNTESKKRKNEMMLRNMADMQDVPKHKS